MGLCRKTWSHQAVWQAQAWITGHGQELGLALSELPPRFGAPATGRSSVPFTEMGTMRGCSRVILGTRMDSSVLDIVTLLKKPLDNTEDTLQCMYLGSQEKQACRGEGGCDTCAWWGDGPWTRGQSEKNCWEKGQCEQSSEAGRGSIVWRAGRALERLGPGVKRGREMVWRGHLGQVLQGLEHRAQELKLDVRNHGKKLVGGWTRGGL